MTRYAIKHKPTGKFFYEDEGGAFLVEEDGDFPIMTYGNKKIVDKMYNDIIKYGDGNIYTDDGKFPIDEFEVAEL